MPDPMVKKANLVPRLRMSVAMSELTHDGIALSAFVEDTSEMALGETSGFGPA